MYYVVLEYTDKIPEQADTRIFVRFRSEDHFKQTYLIEQEHGLIRIVAQGVSALEAHRLVAQTPETALLKEAIYSARLPEGGVDQESLNETLYQATCIILAHRETLGIDAVHDPYHLDLTEARKKTQLDALLWLADACSDPKNGQVNLSLFKLGLVYVRLNQSIRSDGPDDGDWLD